MFRYELLQQQVHLPRPAAAAPEYAGFFSGCHLLRGARDQQFLDLGNGFGRIESFGAGVGAIHDGMAAIKLEGIFERIQALPGMFVATIDDPAIGLQQDRGSQVAIAVPPVTRATGRAAGAEYAFVKAIELCAFLL